MLIAILVLISVFFFSTHDFGFVEMAPDSFDEINENYI
jgi:hypothetical protein